MDIIQANSGKEIFVEGGLPLSTIPCGHTDATSLQNFSFALQSPAVLDRPASLKLDSQKSWLEGTSADHQFNSLLQEGL